MKTAYLSLGSNLGDRKVNIERALELLSGPDLRVLARSSYYETAPQYLTDQPWFLNIAAAIETTLFPRMLLARIARVEKELGRKRTIDKGPRTVDIDILLFGNSKMDTPELTIPHPGMAERRFVLEPLAEIAPELCHPVTRQTIRQMLSAVRDQKVRKLEPEL